MEHDEFLLKWTIFGWINFKYLIDLYQRRFKKERRLRKQLEDQLEMETKKIQALESALRNLSYETLVKVKENIAREAANREKLKLEEKSEEKTEQNGDNSSDEAVQSKFQQKSEDSLAQLNYNISQMTSPPAISFSSSIASSTLPPASVSSSF